MRSGTFAGGVHPPERKEATRDLPIEVLPTPKIVRIALLQHTGAPCEAVVASRQDVTLGEPVGSSDAKISAGVHASVAGKVTKTAATTLPNGRRVSVVPIKAGAEQLEGDELYEALFGGAWPLDELERYDPAFILAAVKAAGVVGMGGAAFPTHVKLAPPPDKLIDTLIVNGCECEPYLNPDQRLMVEAPEPIIAGTLLAAKTVSATRVIVAVEDNKPEAVERLREIAAGTGVEVRQLPTKYPQGSERQLIPAVTGRVVPSPGLPLDIGIVVVNVASAAAVALAVMRGRPVTHRVVTVTGNGIVEPKNLLAPIGCSYGELIERAGGFAPGAARLLAGGPMMGFALGTLDTPLTKGTGGITVLTHEDLTVARETACVRCGRCVDVCPQNLIPTRVALAVRAGAWELARRHYIDSCVECGCCAYACPANLPLVQLIRMGKAQLASAA